MQDQLQFIKDMVAKAEIGANITHKSNQNSNLNAGKASGKENLEYTGPVDAYRNLPRESVQKNDLIQQRNKMIFDEDTGSEGLGASHNQKSLHPADKSAPGQQSHFTLNKYESKKEIAQKDGPAGDDQMETAHWNKNGGH